MFRFLVILIGFLLAQASSASAFSEQEGTVDPFFGEALYYAFQEDWFSSITILDKELGQFYDLDEPELDPLFNQVGMAEFNVGDFELAYRMHHRAGRAIKAVIQGNVGDEVRNEAIFRLARIFFQKNQPANALHALERIKGDIPKNIRDDLEFLKAQIQMANGNFAAAIPTLNALQNTQSYKGFSSYNLGIALIRTGQKEEGYRYLDQTGKINSKNPVILSIKDKANLVLAHKQMEKESFRAAKEIFDRVRLEGPFSNRALLGSGWADASREKFETALVPWTILSKREVTDQPVQEAMLAVPYAYGKLALHGKAAIMYGKALEAFSSEIDKLGSSIKSIREGSFLRALVREEIKRDSNWVVKLRELPETPETYYLLNLMASHSFQESLKNYLDMEQLRKKFESWTRDLDSFEDIISIRAKYYEPLLPEIDAQFRKLDSRMRLRLEQRDHIGKRLRMMLIAPRPDYLATEAERILGEKILKIEQAVATAGSVVTMRTQERVKRLRGLLTWSLYSQYDQRFTDAHMNLLDLNEAVDKLPEQYFRFVRIRQGAIQSYQGYDDTIRRLRIKIKAARKKLEELMARQGHMIEVMALNELTKRRTRLEEFQVKARFALADSYDRATGAQDEAEKGQ